MSLLNILQFPDPRLKDVAAPVEHFDNTLSGLIDNMLETMYETQGVGLAAIQVNVKQRVIVLDVSPNESEPQHLVNPEITARRGVIEWDEGCLSFPGVYAKVKRAKEIDVKYFDRHGNPQELLNATELLGVCIQHEIDHLNGITFYDHLSPLKKELLRKKMEKIRKRSL